MEVQRTGLQTVEKSIFSRHFYGKNGISTRKTASELVRETVESYLVPMRSAQVGLEIRHQSGPAKCGPRPIYKVHTPSHPSLKPRPREVAIIKTVSPYQTPRFPRGATSKKSPLLQLASPKRRSCNKPVTGSRKHAKAGHSLLSATLVANRGQAAKSYFINSRNEVHASHQETPPCFQLVEVFSHSFPVSWRTLGVSL